MVFTCIRLFVLKKRQRQLQFQIEDDFLKIAKINSQQEKPGSPNRKNQFPRNTKNCQSAKLNSRKNLVLGMCENRWTLQYSEISCHLCFIVCKAASQSICSL